MRSGERLAPAETATTVRADAGGDGLLLTDGPFADTKEIFGGSTSSRHPTWTRRSNWPAASRRSGSAGRWRSARWSSSDVSDLAEVFRAEWARVVAALVGFCGDLDVAEDAAQEAVATAARRWPVDGAPDVPRAWLITTARHRALDRLRRDQRLAEKLPWVHPALAEADVTVLTLPDERLELVFLCCHPALAPEARVALTLRAVGGSTRPRSPERSS